MPQLSLLDFRCPAEGTAQQHGKALNADDHTDALQKKQSDVENDPGAVNAPVGQAPSETLAREVSPAKGEVSDYEQARQQRMQANFEKLRSLGLSGGVADVIGAPAPPKKRPSKRKTAQDHAEGAPLRRSTRSTRLSGGAPTPDGSTAGASPAAPCSVTTPSPEEEKLVPAPWLGPETALQLPGTQSGASGDDAWSTQLSAQDDLDGFHAFHCGAGSGELKGIYSLSWYGRLLLAAGKGGICSLYSIPEVAQEEGLESLATCQLHRSWISDAEMLPPLLVESHASTGAGACIEGTPATMPWVVSASNGAELALWNPAHMDSMGRFLQVAEAQNVHHKGIFGMHVCPEATEQQQRSSAASIEVLSCSKDCSVVLTAIKSTGIEVVRRWEGVHEGVAKAVRWRDAQLAASAGNDRVVRLLDPRSEGPTISIEDAHNTAINTLSWASSAAAGSAPGPSTTLLSMSFDPAIKIHDIRRPDRPLAVLRGHTQLPKCKQIQQASFCWGGRGVLCGGEGSDNTKLYLYDIRLAKLVEDLGDGQLSEGVQMLAATELGHGVGSVQLNSSGRFVAAAGGRGSITVSKAILK